MPIFRGSKDATVASGDIVATQGDIAEALTSAQQAQAASEAAQAAAEAALDNFDDRYLGSKASDPTVDNDGDPLIDGALYYNTVNVITRVYDVSEGTWSNLKPSATEQANINALGPIASEVEIVSNNIADVSTVSDNITDVNAVGGNIADVSVVADDLNETVSEIETVANNITNVNNVGNSIADVTDVNTVAGISTDITTVVTFESEIVDVSQSSDAVDIIASDLAGAGFDYDLGTITAVTEGVLGTPNGYIITLFDIHQR